MLVLQLSIPVLAKGFPPFWNSRCEGTLDNSSVATGHVLIYKHKSLMKINKAFACSITTCSNFGPGTSDSAVPEGQD